MAHAFSLRVCTHCRRRVKNVPCREMRGCTQAIGGAAIESPGCAGVFIRSAPLAVRLFPGSNFTISYCFCLLFLLFLSVEKQAAIRRVVRVVEGAALEISAGSVNFVPSKTPANSGFSKFQIEYFYVFSPAFLSKRFCELKTGGNIRRCTQAVEGSALEIVPAIWNTPWRKSLFFKASRALKRLEPLAFSPDFLSNLQGGNQGGNNLGAVSKWS